jgi:hypothetical protein
MTSITQENSIGGPRLKLIKPNLLENKAPTTKSPKMAHSRCSPMHELVARLVQESLKKNPIPNMACGIHRLVPISLRGPMLVEHRPSHLTKGTIFSLNHTSLTSQIGRRELMFGIQITTKGFELRVFKLCAIVSTNRLDPGRNQISPPCQAKRRPKHSENSHPLSQGHTISHLSSTHNLDQPSPYGTDRMASLSYRMLDAGERRRPPYHAYTEHIPNPFGISTLEILGPSLAHLSMKTSQNSSDLVSYAIS